MTTKPPVDAAKALGHVITIAKKIVDNKQFFRATCSCGWAAMRGLGNTEEAWVFNKKNAKAVANSHLIKMVLEGIKKKCA